MTVFGLDRIDRYIGRLFWSSYGVVFLFFFGFFTIIDLTASSDDFLDTMRKQDIPQGRMLRMIAASYLYSSPSVFLQVAPFVTVIGAIMTLARMKRTNEIIPILMSGRSALRLLRPIFLFSGTLMLVMVIVQELVAPVLASRRVALHEFLRHGEKIVKVREVLLDEQGNQWANINFEPLDQTIRSAWITRQQGSLVTFGPVRELRFAPEQGGWVSTRDEKFILKSMMIPEEDSAGSAPSNPQVQDQQMQISGNEYSVISSSLEPREIASHFKEPFDLSFRDLGLLYARTNQARYLVLLHYHITFPITNLLLLLLAIPFVLRHEKHNVLQGLAIAFFFCGAYFAVDFALRTLGLRGTYLHPVLAAWFAPIFFGALGISLFDGIRS